jgi:RNA polymerase sigma-B factor
MPSALDSVTDARLACRHRDGDPAARAALIERYLPLARAIALRYRASREPFDDLFQVACLGLVKAVDGWEPERGLAFSTYAVPTITGQVRRHFRDTTWSVRPPRAVLELAVAVERAREPLRATLGREATVDELARHLGRPPDDVAEAVRAAQGRSTSSLEALAAEAQPGSRRGATEPGADDSGYEEAEARLTLERMSVGLDRRSRAVLRLRFEHGLFHAEIAGLVGCSQQHVSRLLAASLEHLRAVAGGAAA